MRFHNMNEYGVDAIEPTQEDVRNYEMTSFENQNGTYAVSLKADDDATQSAIIDTNVKLQDAENYFGANATEQDQENMCCTFTMSTHNISTPVAKNDIETDDQSQTISFPVYQGDPGSGVVPFQPLNPPVRICIRWQDAQIYSMWKDTILRISPPESPALPLHNSEAGGFADVGYESSGGDTIMYIPDNDPDNDETKGGSESDFAKVTSYKICLRV